MKINDIWQNCHDDWQPLFIRENIISISYQAWAGYLAHGRGLVVCEVNPPTDWKDWRFYISDAKFRFLPLPAAIAHLKQLELFQDDICDLIQRLEAYCPEAEMMVLVLGNGEMQVTVLRNLAIAPSEGYAQFCRRREEFQIDGDTVQEVFS